MEKRTILFYDGVCGLCDRTVQFLLNHAKRETSGPSNEGLYFSPLQGETAKTILAESDRRDLSSVVLVQNGVIYRKARAIAQTSGYVRAPWNLILSGIRGIPIPLANFSYDLVARFRYQVFGKFESCKLPRPEERRHFLP
ncbi:MAG: DCC1-like thiol-disulfide oxidoreductase family protein [Bdellovibrionales bacterium]|nr:DCC1-like thiol-disulfide oxidoreductase family protein [Bdellovibrionales bacterium]